MIFSTAFSSGVGAGGGLDGALFFVAVHAGDDIHLWGCLSVDVYTYIYIYTDSLVCMYRYQLGKRALQDLNPIATGIMMSFPRHIAMHE
jgi:hypothetical protein